MTVKAEIVLHGIERLYIDANILIYTIEESGTLRSKSIRSIASCLERGIPISTSEYSLAECLIGVYRNGHEPLADVYRDLLLDEAMINLVPISLELLELSAQTGASYNLRLADAIHVASALATACDAFLTNDRRVRAPDHLKIIQLSEIE